MRHRLRSFAVWRAPRSPADLPHHAIVRDVHPAVFDAVVRLLRQRLYGGRVVGPAACGTRAVALRQGAPAWIAGAAAVAVAASVAAPSWVTLIVAGCAVAGFAVAARAPRKHVWVTAVRGESPDRCDLWMAGGASWGADAFASEFERLVAAAIAPDAAVRAERAAGAPGEARQPQPA